jgi:hypothetical protein
MKKGIVVATLAGMGMLGYSAQASAMIQLDGAIFGTIVGAIAGGPAGAAAGAIIGGAIGASAGPHYPHHHGYYGHRYLRPGLRTRAGLHAVPVGRPGLQAPAATTPSPRRATTRPRRSITSSSPLRSTTSNPRRATRKLRRAISNPCRKTTSRSATRIRRPALLRGEETRPAPQLLLPVNVRSGAQPRFGGAFSLGSAFGSGL